MKLAVSDVTKLAAALSAIATAGGYNVPNPILLPEKEAYKDNIELTFKDLAALEVQQQDGLIVLLAGHGVSDGKCYYYVPFGASLGDGRTITTEGVTCQEWEEWLGKVQVGKKALFIDTCESADATTIFRASEDEETRRESTFERIVTSTGHSIFTAARDAAREDGSLGHGVLTYAVLQALARPGPRGNLVDADSIKIHVEDEVPHLSKTWYGQPQKPVVEVKGEFPLGPPQQGIAPKPPVPALPGRYVIRESDKPIIIRSKPGREGEDRGSIESYTGVRVYKFNPGWALIGKEGKPMGWVPDDAVRKVH